MRKLAPMLALILMLAAYPALVRAGAPAGGLELNTLVQVLYTHRDRHERTWVEGIDQFTLRWVGLELTGQSGRVSWRLEAVAARGIHYDPILMTGTTTAFSSNDEMGTVGLREARIDLALPYATLTFGTFIPDWGVYQERQVKDRVFVDLPMIYTHESMRAVGWQNAGAGVSVKPIEQMELEAFYFNGYFPGAWANTESFPPRGLEKALMGRLTVRLGGFSVFGGYYAESWSEDTMGGPGAEDQEARAWIAGAELETEKLWMLFEWTDLVIEDYQLRTDGLGDLESMGGHADLAWRMIPGWEAVLRWDWIDPNTADSKKTFMLSRFNQVTQWTAGINYSIGPSALFMVNYVVPIEEGSQVDLEEGKVGGKYQGRQNNYFRVQLQVHQ